VGGSRRKGKERADPKGKKRQRASSGSDDEEPAPKRGRPTGSSNYSKEDVKKLFDFIQLEQPVGQKGWKEVHRHYKKYARANGRAKRGVSSLENKFKSVRNSISIFKFSANPASSTSK
jgi:hypothetical protein